MPLFNHFKRRIDTELQVESWVEIDFIQCLLYEPLLRFADFVYEVNDLFVIFGLNLLLGRSGDNRHRVLLLTGKFVHPLNDFKRFEVFQIFFCCLAFLFFFLNIFDLLYSAPRRSFLWS